MKIEVPNLSLVVLVGASGSGKSTFAAKHFLPTEVLSSDECRGLVSDDENDQAATNDAFEVLHFIAGKRLAAGRLTVVDATNVQPESRKPLIALARQYHCLSVAIVFNLPERVCQERNEKRTDRDFGPHVIRGQRSQLRRSLGTLRREGFHHVYVLQTPEEVEAATITRVPLWNDKRDEHGPFDIIGDVHGCIDELMALLAKLGYDATQWSRIAPPPGRKVIFLGDLVDRGPNVVEVLNLVMSMVAQGIAFCVPGNHDVKLLRKLAGKNVQITHGMAETLEQLEKKTTPDDRGDIAKFIDSLVSHYVLDGGKLVVAHAGLRQEMHGRGSAAVRDFALYGETTGETDEFGLPVRYPWAAEYRGAACVVYGHTPVPEAEWLNRTVNIDTGCVFGGKLTALRYPEKELISVPAAQTYCQPAKPFLPAEQQAPALSAQQQQDDLLDAQDVLGKRIIATRLKSNIIIREANATAALEVMSRFAANPTWLIYLPPTMSPCETSTEAGYLEYPTEAFTYYRQAGVPKVVCEQKHMGSRAVMIVCRDAEVARKRFGVVGDESGIVYTRTGRRFFEDRAIEDAMLARVRAAIGTAGLWDELATDWMCLDCELMPWSAKAQELLKSQYAAVGAAAEMSLDLALNSLEIAAKRQADDAQRAVIEGLLEKLKDRREAIDKYIAAYRQYCWPVSSLDDLKLAPFHLLASEGKVHIDCDHVWHMDTLARICRGDDKLLLATPYKVIDVTNPDNVAAGTQWWLDLTGSGGEGMVVKPLDFIARDRRGLVQPAVKCRGREYLRIIYGPEYTAPQHLDRLRKRGLMTKRALAIQELALGIESLERFVHREPLRRVHECVFGVLAMESEPVDPRL